MQIKNKIALVTGGTKGIGRAITEMLIKQGAIVIANYRSDTKNANEFLHGFSEEIRNKRLFLFKGDVSDKQVVENLFDYIKTEFKQLDILVNNVATFDENDAVDNIQAFEKLFKANFMSHIIPTSYALNVMKKGKIIFIGSIHGQLGMGESRVVAYATMKAALNSYTKILAKETAPEIIVNAIAPGKVLTSIYGEFYTSNVDDKTFMQHIQAHLIKRWIKPQEIAHAVKFLLENDAIVGQILTVDLGMHLETTR